MQGGLSNHVNSVYTMQWKMNEMILAAKEPTVTYSKSLSGTRMEPGTSEQVLQKCKMLQINVLHPSLKTHNTNVCLENRSTFDW